MLTQGYGAWEVAQAYTRARELCQRVGETPQRFAALSGVWLFSLIRAEYQTAHELAAQHLRLAQRVGNPTFLMSAHWLLGATFQCLGELPSARTHLEQSLGLYDPQQHNPYVSDAATDPQVATLSWLAKTLWQLGYPDQALERNKQAISLAQRLPHPFSLALALNFVSGLLCDRGEWQTAQGQAEAGMDVCHRHGFPDRLAWGTAARGWALVGQADTEAGLAQIRKGMAAWQATGAAQGRPWFLACLAYGHCQAKQTAAGLEVVAEALEVVGKTGERRYEAELYRLKGELLLNDERKTHEAEACFQHAIDTARGQSAKSFELRAVLSLSRLWQKQAKQQEAGAMLREIYAWFTEGFDTADLKAAKRLLDALS